MYYMASAGIVDKLAGTGEGLLAWFDQHAVNIIVILVGAWLIRHFSATIINRILAHTVRADLYPSKIDRQKRIKTLRSLTRAIVRTGVYIVATVLIIGEINPNYATALFASLGLLTVALGLGARDVVNDFLSGLFIITESQYRVGDFVEIAGVRGTVEAVTIRSTVLRDQNGDVHHVANGDILVATNKTFGHSNLNEELVVAPDTNLDQLIHIINHAGEELAAKAELKHKITKPPFFDGLDGYRQGGMVVKISGTTTASEKYIVRSELYTLLNKAFLKHDIKLVAVPPATPTPEKK